MYLTLKSICKFGLKYSKITFIYGPVLWVCVGCYVCVMCVCVCVCVCVCLCGQYIEMISIIFSFQIVCRGNIRLSKNVTDLGASLSVTDEMVLTKEDSWDAISFRCCVSCWRRCTSWTWATNKQENIGLIFWLLQAGYITHCNERRNEMFYLTTHSSHFIYGYMASDIWLRTILIVRKETRCRHIGYSFWLTARVLLYAPSDRQDSTYHGLCYHSRGALAGTTQCNESWFTI